MSGLAADGRPGLRICIAVPTRQRPAQLTSLLAELPRQSVAGKASIDVAVIDNDAGGSAKSIADGVAAGFPWPLHYLPVPARGYSTVRNAALDFALDRFDLLAMIDDDETPERQWLESLLATMESTGADAVIGPVPACLPVDAPRWIANGHFFDLAQFPDGSLIDDGYTGNCLLRLSKLAALGLRFDMRLNQSGGEDQLFFRELFAQGGRIVYAATAIAIETIPASRLRARFLVKRNFRKGHTLSLCDRTIHGTRRVLATRMAKALGRILVAMTLCLPRITAAGRGGGLTTLCDLAFGLGMLAGLVDPRAQPAVIKRDAALAAQARTTGGEG